MNFSHSGAAGTKKAPPEWGRGMTSRTRGFAYVLFLWEECGNAGREDLLQLSGEAQSIHLPPVQISMIISKE